MRGQRATIRIITDEFLGQQRMNKYMYEVMSVPATPRAARVTWPTGRQDRPRDAWAQRDAVAWGVSWGPPLRRVAIASS
jgi:hypothetical protein